jgi:hypothetical protein
MPIPTKDDVDKWRILAWGYVGAAIFCLFAGYVIPDSPSWWRETWRAKTWVGACLLIGIPEFGVAAYICFQFLFGVRYLRKKAGLTDRDP